MDQHNPLATEARDALGQWLQTFDWDCFATFTFKDLALGRPTLAVDRAERVLSQHGMQAAFIAAEPHYLAGMHAHGLVKWKERYRVDREAHRDVAEVRPYKRHVEVKAHWTRTYGWGSFTVPLSGAAAVYVAKYVLKDRVSEWRISGRPVPTTP